MSENHAAPGPYRPVALIVLDGWGQAPTSLPGSDAITYSRTPNLDRWRATYPTTLLGASGEDVGLLPGQMGDSNVGHLNLGAGRIVYQDLVRINQAVADGSLAANSVLEGLMAGAASRGATLHLLGLVSDGGVHSHLSHLEALLAVAAHHGVRRLAVHAFLDGRDVPPVSAAGYLERLSGSLAAYRDQLAASGGADASLAAIDWRIASLAGRYFAMDRDKRWERTASAFESILGSDAAGPGDSRQLTAGLTDWRAALELAYLRGETDEFVHPVRLAGAPPVAPDDAVLFFNFRADRARQLVRSFLEQEHEPLIQRPEWFPLSPDHVATMTRYYPALPCPVVFAPLDLRDTLGEVVSRAGLRQLRLAETEKYAHVTHFFSGGREEPFAGEERLLIPSPKVPTYDQQPEMSAPQVAAAAERAVAGRTHDLLVINFANGDMVGHTGDYRAALAAVAAVDAALGQVVDAVLAVGGAALVVADHGNAEQMFDRSLGLPHTAHTGNPVPALLVARGLPPGLVLRPGVLGDVAPTVLDLMGISVPPAMTGRSLLDPEGAGQNTRE